MAKFTTEELFGAQAAAPTPAPATGQQRMFTTEQLFGGAQPSPFRSQAHGGGAFEAICGRLFASIRERHSCPGDQWVPDMEGKPGRHGPG